MSISEEFDGAAGGIQDEISEGGQRETAPAARLRIGAERAFLQEDPRQKSTVLAALMSLAPGIGQVYLGYYQQGFINILVVASLITALVRGVGDFEPFCGIFLAFYWLFNIVDAWRRASLYNFALAGLGSSELPDRISARPGRESLFAGVILMIAGVVILGHTRFGLSMYWLEQWWPAAFVLMGGYLVYVGLADRRVSAN